MQSNQHCIHCGNIHPDQSCATNITEFIWKNGGKQVFITGSWNSWQTYNKMIPMKNNPQWFSLVLSLQAGVYQYKYIVDGQWRLNLDDQQVSDQFGRINNKVEVQPRILLGNESDYDFSDEQSDVNDNQQQQQQKQLIKIKTYLNHSNLSVMGSWDNWQKAIKMEQRFNHATGQNQMVTKLFLLPGKYSFKFKSNDQMFHDPDQKHEQNTFGTYDNCLWVVKDQNHLIKNRIIVNKKLFKIEHLIWITKIIKNIYWDKMIQGHTMNTVCDKVYLFGGQKGGEFMDTLYVYNILTQELDIEDMTGPLPCERAFHSALTFGNKILVYGGINSKNVLCDYFVYNTTTKQWYTVELKGDKPCKRERNTVNLYQKELLILFGGYYCSEDLEAEYTYNDLYFLTLKSLVWNKKQTQGPKPEPRFAHTANIFSNYLYIFGGMQKVQGRGQDFNDMWRINVDQETLVWQNLSQIATGAPPSPRHGHISIILQKHIIIYGGRNDQKEIFGDTYAFDLKNFIWTKLDYESGPKPRYYHSACSISKEQAIVFGGNVKFGQKNRRFYIIQPDKEAYNKILESKKEDEDSNSEEKQKNKKK